MVAEITASMVKELREKTDAPMMECKKALVEADGDMAQAEELLRVKLGSKASKAASRVTAEGLVGVAISDDSKRGALVEVNCETDFVAKNEEFIKFVSDVADLVAEKNPADIAALGALPLGGKTVEEFRAELIGRIGENITIRRFERFETEGRLSEYVHGGKIGVVINHTGSDEVGRDVAMHVAAMRPQALSREQLDSEVLEREARLAEEKAKELGRPEHIIEKIVTGTVDKYVQETTLLGQAFVKDDKKSVEQMLKENDATVNAYAIFVVGEGIERRQEDFAAEVAAAQKSS
ncbi:MAG TPA: translation elongation factor Ts [Paenalcaligenes sp.]|nr:translation elongation factor Ts [Paenalcaligenes sp.]